MSDTFHGRIASRPRWRASPRATACLGLSALIACAGCVDDSADFNNRIAARIARQDFERAVDHCLHRMTGPFGSATLEQLRECERRASSGDAR